MDRSKKFSVMKFAFDVENLVEAANVVLAHGHSDAVGGWGSVFSVCALAQASMGEGGVVLWFLALHRVGSSSSSLFKKGDTDH